MTASLEPFFREGVRRYVDAKHAVRSFEEELQRRIDRALKSFKDWGPLKIRKLSKSYAGSDEGGLWIAGYVEGRLGRVSADIDCGVWWEAPGQPAPVIYASFFTGPKQCLVFEYKPKARDGAVRVLNRWRRTFLLADVPEDLDIPERLHRLLAILIRQLNTLR